MSLTNRKTRPLKRNDTEFRDDRLFLIASDDTYAPKQYFDFFAISRIKVLVIPNEDNGSHAQQVVDRIRNYRADDLEEYDERWILLDTDHCVQSAHISSYMSAIRQAKELGINIAISRSCFEVWLLLHYVDVNEVSGLGNAADVEAALRRKIGSYNKTNLKAEHFPLSLVVDACQRAKRLDSMVLGGDIPESTTSRVYLLWQAIASKALRTQLPQELWPLISD
ncbi:RloB family protein [Undibacterium baiyunense]|uniref:RloB domain-containing protein n=1 Tax=Undibacterium baiyunense TaxID=2828731 RepID=A0A941I4X9_9BURK|nr:RloB family protein [Undibacterium baiyunense]MBR7747951.1 RloB domain-containing protein [Undibacterium baiyunense]